MSRRTTNVGVEYLKEIIIVTKVEQLRRGTTIVGVE
jgi:hypothetical protein